MKSALSRYNGLLAILLTACGLLYVVPVAAGGFVTGVEECNNDHGWSIPGLSKPMPYCTKKDCCNWYQTAHVHDVSPLSSYIADKAAATITYSHTPGFTHNCGDTLTLSTSTDGTDFTTQETRQVVSQWQGGHWRKYTENTVTVIAPFNYIKIAIPHCYNDYSSIDKIEW